MTATETAEVRRTPLHGIHTSRGAKMMPFAGWEMPVNYSAGIIAEHLHTRSKASLFDVSHMLQYELRGDNITEAIERLVPSSITKLSDNAARYTVLTNNDGGIIDDLIITNASDHLFCVSNASRCVEDIEHLSEQLDEQSIVVRDDLALIALQGPAAMSVVAGLSPGAAELKFMQSGTFSFCGESVRISRLGYTGEDGVEISVPATEAHRIAEELLSHSEVEPAGLGARDSLRLEACLCLYGHELDETTTPIEAGLGWTIPKRRRNDGGFLGYERIRKDIAEGAPRKLVGILPSSRAPARDGVEILDTSGASIGRITSGGYSPTLQKPISIGYVTSEHSATGTDVLLSIRGKNVPACISDMPFVHHNYHR